MSELNVILYDALNFKSQGHQHNLTIIIIVIGWRIYVIFKVTVQQSEDEI